MTRCCKRTHGARVAANAAGMFCRAACVLLTTLFVATGARAQDITPQQTDSLNRSVAVVMSGSLTPIIENLIASGLPVDKAEVGRYIAECLSGVDQNVTVADANAYVDNMLRDAARRQNQVLPAEGQQKFVDEMAAQPGAIVTPSGLVFSVIVEGEGPFPTDTDSVWVKYVGRFSDGTVFDDTESQTVKFNLSQEIDGFSEGLKMMKPGGTYRIVMPASLAYGEEGIPGIIPGNAALDFTVTLDRIEPSN